MTAHPAPGAAPPGGALAIEARLRARMRPLIVLVAIAVALTAPVALFAFRMRETRQEAQDVARYVAAVVQAGVVESPTLWRYNTPKLVDHVRAFRARPGVRHIAVVDARGALVETGGPDPTRDRALRDVWATAAIGPAGAPLGAVWVAVTSGPVWREAALALGGFTLLGLALATLVHRIPVHSARRAERRLGELVAALDASRADLARLNQGLEREVAARSADLVVKERRLRDVSTRAATLQDEQRRAIARELHDGVGQALTAVRLQLQVLEAQVAGPPRAVATRALGLLDEAIDEVRRALTDLAPAILDELGLAGALASYCADFAERTGLAVERTLGPLPDGLSPALETTCYRIVQEALTNVAKHAAARRVQVRLVAEPDRLVLQVADDGRGLADGSSGEGGGRGLRGVRERVWLLGGEVAVASAPGGGALLTVVLPLAAEPDAALPPGAGT